jgi:hypothetical protein
MVTARQKREIKKRMARIKEAKRNGASEEEIRRRAKDLQLYLSKEGLIQ